MKLYELFNIFLKYFKPPLYTIINRKIKKIIIDFPSHINILDIGGRKSYYTIGISANIIITDLPRKNKIQKQLNLGINHEIINQIFNQRSNITNIVFDDMTQSTFSDSSFDCAIAIEVLEHVKKDDLFIKEVKRILTKKGVFLMTTPNGDSVKNLNPDHIRHYTKTKLNSCLSKYFNEVYIEYAIKKGMFHSLGLKPWSLKNPFKTFLSMICNIINLIQSSKKSLINQSQKTCHLIAIAKNPIKK